MCGGCRPYAYGTVWLQATATVALLQSVVYVLHAGAFMQRTPSKELLEQPFVSKNRQLCNGCLRLPLTQDCTACNGLSAVSARLIAASAMPCHFTLHIVDNAGVASSYLVITLSAKVLYLPGARLPPCCLQVQVSREVQRVRDYEAMQLRCYQVGMIKCAADQWLLISSKYLLGPHSSASGTLRHAASAATRLACGGMQLA